MVTVENLVKTYTDGINEVPVIRGANLSLSKGEMVALVGVSGAGKTTLLQMLGGLDIPTSGLIKIDNEELTSLHGEKIALFRNKKIGFVFQFHHLLPDFTAIENVFMPGLIGGITVSAGIKRAQELLDLVGMNTRMTHFPSQLSGGERQRVALARSLFNKPALILADEPTGNLDREHTALMLELMHRTNREFGQTFLIATHNEQVWSNLHRTVVLEYGKIVNQ